ncbi:hypothetical protein [Sulfitobacter noctilucae]|uniref:hypothetical protein n=1 Tax=Sulfitobacter noctilucae TaxID=1342302 RepID=UPI000468A4F8|nr:hypothetical protein [Sulfitobacter noctilucae]
MDVILHMGAHRTATTTFQYYIRDHLADLSKQGVAFWGPQEARKSVFPGLFRSTVSKRIRNPALRAEGRVRMFAAQAQARGVRQLLVSDENMLGNCAQNLRSGQLYPAAGERAARISAALGGRVRRIVLSIRSQELWWASACALTVSRGHPVPSSAKREAISHSRRCWRDVITDLACAAPGAEIDVLPFEGYVGQPQAVFGAAFAGEAPADTQGRWLNRSADLRSLRAGLAEQGSDPDLLPDGAGRWQPFDTEQSVRLAENYADDMHWLMAGADGLATLTETSQPIRADISLPPAALIKGQGYDKGQLAQHR